MLVLHKEFAALVKANELYAETLNNINKGLRELTKGKLPLDDETKPVLKPAKKHPHRKAPPTKTPEVKTAGNGSKPIPKSRITDQEKERIRQLDKEGLSGGKIAKTIGRSQPAVASFLRSERKPAAQGA